MTQLQTIEVPVAGMDCAECTAHVRHAIAGLDGVASVEVFLASERAKIVADPDRVSLDAIRQAVEGAGYSMPDTPAQAASSQGAMQSRRAGLVLAGLAAVVLLVVIAGEWLGLFDWLTENVPWPIGVTLVVVAGFPVFRNVVRATLQGHIISHTLMTLGVVAALAVGQWPTALVVVFFMRVGDFVEGFTTDRARKALRDLAALAPAQARVLRDGEETTIPAAEVRPGEIVIVRPGEQIPVDGEVMAGQAAVNQASITGESMPMEAGPGSQVFAASYAQSGYLRIRAIATGPDTTFAQVIRLVEEAEAHRSHVQQAADRFSAYFLPIVAGIGLLTLVLRRDPLAAAAVLVVACSCSIALATPIAMLASIGAAAKRGLLIKGGRYIEALAQADVLLIDKTGTLTLGRPVVTDVIVADGEWPSAISHPLSADELLLLAASAERYSEHPLAAAVRASALERGLTLLEPSDFTAEPGMGVRATVDGHVVAVGRPRHLSDEGLREAVAALEADGKTAFAVTVDGQVRGILAVRDALRPEAPAAIAAVRRLGITHIELLTGDNERTAAALAERIGVAYRAGLLPEDKLRIVREYQAQGRVVVMVGDGVNDAPALAQADVGIAMGVTGADVAIEAADIAVLRDDWSLIPELFGISGRTMRVVKTNLGFTAVYNVVGLGLAAFGFLPPIWAAAAQSLPDLGILANSSRLLRQSPGPE